MQLNSNKYIYSLQDFINITFDGFEVVLPEETIEIITELTKQVGSPTYIKSPTFVKKENSLLRPRNGTNSNLNGESGDIFKKRRRGNRGMEVNDEDWETLRTFQPTLIEQKTGLEGQIDIIRSYLNKMTEKNYAEQSNNIIEILNNLMHTDSGETDMLHVGNAIFDIASNNRFYSKLYADLYTLLITKFDMMGKIFINNFNAYLLIFENIEHANAETDYDNFCRVNKDNEKRKSLSSFFVNLTTNNIISVEKIIEIIFNLLRKIVIYIKEENRKNEVDEMIENIAILYNKEWLHGCNTLIDGESFMDVVRRLAHSKAKSYPSLSNKTIFKFMDMIDM